MTEGLSYLDKEINQELSQGKDLNSVKLPYVIKNHVLMSPGVWNNYKYTKQTINEALSSTQWSQKTCSLFWEHEDDSAKEWVGEIKNPHVSDGNLLGDVYVVDLPLAIKLEYGAKFGISPKIAGIATFDRVVKDATFENFSIVLNPAVKTTFLNSEIKIEGGKMEADEKMASELTELKGLVSTLSEQVKAMLNEQELAKKKVEEEMAKKKAEEEIKKKMEEELAKKKAEEEGMKKYPYPAEMTELLNSIKVQLEELKKPEPKKEEEKPAEKCEEKAGPAGDVEADLGESSKTTANADVSLDITDSQKVANELKQITSVTTSAKFANAPTDADIGMANYLTRCVQ